MATLDFSNNNNNGKDYDKPFKSELYRTAKTDYQSYRYFPTWLVSSIIRYTAIIFFVVMLISLIYNLSLGNVYTPSFINLLDYLSRIDSYIIPRITSSSWGVFAWLADILNFITFIINGLLQLVQFAFYLLRFILGF